MKSTETIGEFSILVGSILWGLFPVITILSFHSIAPLVSLGISTLFAALFFAIMLSVRKKWHEIKNFSALKDILLGTFFIGILYYVFYFFGLQHTTAGNASIIALTEIFFSFLLFHVYKKDHIPFVHITGAVCMIIGAFIVLFPGLNAFQIGDVLVLTAAFVAPFGNLFQQKARKKVSSESILFVRSLISGIIILLFAFAVKTNTSYFSIKSGIVFLILNGIFILGLSKILWIEGIHRISVTKATALESTSPLITLLFAWILLKNTPTIWQLLAFIPMVIGIILLGKKK